MADENENGLLSMIPVVGPILQTGMDLLFQKHNNRNQLQQQQALTNQQVAAQKDLGEFNQRQAMEMWERTNYDAQRRQMEKAGLNVGLMYKGTGPGGTTQGGQAGSATGGQAAAGPPIQARMGMALELAMMQAQVKNIEADTKKKEAETPATGQTEALKGQEIEIAKANAENIRTNTEKMKAETDNAKLQNSIMELQKQLEQINLNVAKGSEAATIEQNNQLARKYAEDVRSLKNQNEITEKTKNYQIEQARLAVTEANMRIKLAESGLEVNQATITKMSMDLLNKQEELRQNNRSLDQKDVQNMLQKWQTEFNVGFSTQGGILNAAKVWNEIIPF